MEKNLEKELENKLSKLYLKEQRLYLRSKSNFYKKETIHEDIKNFLEYCISERKEWARREDLGEGDFWKYAFYLGNQIMRWGKKY